MFSDEVTLPKAAEIVDLAAIVVSHLKELRDKTTDEEWDSFHENEKMDELLCSLLDLESSIDDD